MGWIDGKLDGRTDGWTEGGWPHPLIKALARSTFIELEKYLANICVLAVLTDS